jgi:hypothetical protein
LHVIVGQKIFELRPVWTIAGKSLVKKFDGYSYVIEKENKNWILKIHSRKRSKRINYAFKGDLAVVCDQITAMVIVGLLEIKKGDLKPYELGRPGKISFGRKNFSISKKAWDIKGDHAYNQEGLCAYYLWRPDGCKANDLWYFEIRFPGGSDSKSNCKAWQLKNIISLEIGQAAATLMRRG